MANIFTATTTAASSESLVTLSRTKRYAGASGSADDAKWAECISAASRLVEDYCDRLFLSGAYTEYYDGNGRDRVTLAAFPVTVGPKVRYATAAMEVSNSDTTNNQEAYVSARDTGMDLVRYDTSGTAVTVTIAWTAAKTLTALAALVNAQGNGWAATVVADYANWNPSLIRPSQGRNDAYAGSAVTLEVFASGPQYTRCNTETGTVWLDCPAPCGVQNVRVDYTGGYETIPEPVQQATAALAAALFEAGKRSGGLTGERIGDYSWTAAPGGAVGAVESLSPDAALLLRRYRRVRCL